MARREGAGNGGSGVGMDMAMGYELGRVQAGCCDPCPAWARGGPCRGFAAGVGRAGEREAAGLLAAGSGVPCAISAGCREKPAPGLPSPSPGSGEGTPLPREQPVRSGAPCARRGPLHCVSLGGPAQAPRRPAGMALTPCLSLHFRLRSVKMEQRKLNDQANTLVDLAKVSGPRSPVGTRHPSCRRHPGAPGLCAQLGERRL